MDILIDSGSKKYIEKLQKLQFRGIKIISQYCFQGHKILTTMKKNLHTELGLHIDIESFSTSMVCSS